MKNEVRCPHCKRLIVEDLVGMIEFTCPDPRCKKKVIIDRRRVTA